MIKKTPKLKVEMMPIARGLPSNIAASIGRTITRHSYLEWSLAKSIYNLLGISIKQGRATIKLPPPYKYVATIETLLEYEKLKPDEAELNRLQKLHQAADLARNTLAHSIYMRDPKTKKIKIQLVWGDWQLGQHYEQMSRIISPEGKTVDRAFLAEKRSAVEKAIRLADQFRLELNAQLRALNEIRRTQSSRDRRKWGHRRPAPPNRRLSSPR